MRRGQHQGKQHLGYNIISYVGRSRLERESEHRHRRHLKEDSARVLNASLRRHIEIKNAVKTRAESYVCVMVEATHAAARNTLNVAVF